MILDFIDMKTGPKAMYLRLYKGIKQGITCGVIKNGDRLPSIREVSAQLGISRTTVENAYIKLCIEGLAESLPQKGYYIRANLEKRTPEKKAVGGTHNILYDFSGRSIDNAAADTDLWKKTVREVLRDTGELQSYGDPQGEIGLREALADYSYKARGVRCNPENIILGAGVGPLLNLLSGIIGREAIIGMESSFIQAEQIFSDYGIKTQILHTDSNGIIPDCIKDSKVNTLFLMPSNLSKISVTAFSSRRNAIADWARENNGIIIEDDYNGELRVTARGVTAFQGKCPERTVYIGSFSKLLLPSIRIAFMVLPDFLMDRFNWRKKYYNQTCGKIEQLALKNYIVNGALERHLKRLRKLYSAKSQGFTAVLKEVFPKCNITLLESSLIVKLETWSKLSSKEICEKAFKKGIKVIESENIGEVKMCFAGIKESDFKKALILLKECI